jgi:glycosyltransferase involved in cell wall biosynthesis
MTSFICATYNEQYEIIDLLEHVKRWVNLISICDDGSTDLTSSLITLWKNENPNIITRFKSIPHTGLPETVKNEALKEVPIGRSWVVMLDADERFAPGVWDKIYTWLNSRESDGIDYVYFQQLEIIDGNHVRTFQKSKLFRKDAIIFSSGIHEDDSFIGEGIYNPEFLVYHRKSSDKQVQREREYLETYKRLLDEGKIDQGRYEWLRGLHHYIR